MTADPLFTLIVTHSQFYSQNPVSTDLVKENRKTEERPDFSKVKRQLYDCKYQLYDLLLMTTMHKGKDQLYDLLLMTTIHKGKYQLYDLLLMTTIHKGKDQLYDLPLITRIHKGKDQFFDLLLMTAIPKDNLAMITLVQ